VILRLGEERIDRTLNDYLWERCRIVECAYDVTPAEVTRGSIHLVPSSLKVNEITRVLHQGYDARLLKDGFKDLIQELSLDYLMIDTHPGLNEETLLSIAISHILIVILRPDQQDYQGTSVTLEVAKRLGVPNTYLVLNKALPDVEPGIYRAQVAEAYNTEVGAILPLATEVVRLASSDIFLLLQPQHPFSQEIAALGSRLIALE
jgi:MinD-like ATPase involved in chromosome partitioning or flagellar assembly